MAIPPRILKVRKLDIDFVWHHDSSFCRKRKDSRRTQSLASTPSQMRRIQDISLLRSLAPPRLHMKVEFSIASFSCQMSTQWCHQRSFSEPRSTTRTSTSLVESAWISWRTSGLPRFRLDRCCCQFKPWCLSQTWMIPWIRRLPMLGKLIRRQPSRRPRSGRFSTPTTEQSGVPHWGMNYTESINHIMRQIVSGEFLSRRQRANHILFNETWFDRNVR